MTTLIPASEAKARFSELLERVQTGETFSITLHGEERAKLIPAKRTSLEEIQATIARMKSGRSRLNSPGQPRLKVKELIGEGRP
jgi:prevent-host-death family protein